MDKNQMLSPALTLSSSVALSNLSLKDMESWLKATMRRLLEGGADGLQQQHELLQEGEHLGGRGGDEERRG